MYKRAFFIYGVLAAFLVVLMVHLYGIATDSTYAFLEERNYEYKIAQDSIRGNIYDCNLTPLINTETEYVTVVEPQYFQIEQSQDLAKMLSIDAEVIQRGLSQNKPFTVVSDNQVTAEGLTVFERSKRYNDEQMAVHITGYLGSDGGLAGMERVFDSFLDTGERSYITYTGDVTGGSISGFGMDFYNGSEEKNKGIKTTIDLSIQKIAEEAADRYIKKGAIVILDVQTGQIKASVSRPDFNPNAVENYFDSEDGEFINRALAAYPLGSVFKTVVVAAAFEEQAEALFEEHECVGYEAVGDKIFSCLKKSGHGNIGIEKAFCVSCNSFFINLCLKSGGISTVLPYAKRLGFGNGTEFAKGFSSQSGNLPSLKKEYEPAESANFALGQGDLLVTPLQAARLMATVASGGIDHEPSLFISKVNSDKKDIENLLNEKETRVLSESTAKYLQKLLRLVVTDGTGGNAQPEGVSVAGKTGSAEASGGVVHGWFCGYFPASNPKYAVAVICENGRTGGESAAPAFAYIAKWVSKR